MPNYLFYEYRLIKFQKRTIEDKSQIGLFFIKKSPPESFFAKIVGDTEIMLYLCGSFTYRT